MSLITPRVLAFLVCTAVICAGLTGCEKEPPSKAAATPAPAPAPTETERESMPAETTVLSEVDVAEGWIATVSGLGGSATALMPTASFRLEPDESLHPRIAPNGLNVEYAGTLAITTPGTYRLVAEVEGGDVSVRCFDPLGNERGVTKPARVPRIVQTDWMPLVDEPHTVLVSFERRDDAPARLRLKWERQGVGSDGFAAEAIPAAMVSVPSESQTDARRATLAMEGRVLLGELGCVNCHATDASTAHAIYPRQAPLLGEIGKRASGSWISGWISHSQNYKPGSGMPNVFLEPEEDEVTAITNYLVSLGGPAAEQPVATEESVFDQGRRLYHSVGCVSCHGAIESPMAVYDEPGLPTEIPDHDPPHPFGSVWGKWSDGEPLSDFLQDPARTHPSGRMPAMNLSESEADLIATYLRRTVGTQPLTVSAVLSPWEYDESQVEAGKAAFSARGCANCHQIGHNQAPAEPGVMSIDLVGVIATKGPMDPDDMVHVKYDLTPRQREALTAAIEEIQMGAAHAAPNDDAWLRISALGCLTCHSKDERGGLADGVKPYLRTNDEAELGDEGRFPPHLSGVGFKLTTPWLQEVLTDSGQVRPYMSARMPQFGDDHVGVLAAHLAALDGVHPNSDDTEPQITDEMVMAGHTLAGEGGLNCISCHVFDDLPPAGTPGPDMTTFAERLRYAWWRGYVLDPPRFKPGTRMPLFYYSGRGAITDVYNGDPHRQADAMWAYFTLGGFMPVPEGLDEGDSLALRVSEKPMVFRTYLQDAGSRAIAIGFPIGLHFAYDADKARLVDAWKGEFIDATSAWKGRGGNYADGQGPVIWSAPDGPAIFIGDEPDWDSFEHTRFRGYRFDDDDMPVFRSEFRANGRRVQIEELVMPLDVTTGSFRRRFTISDHDQQTIWINSGVTGMIAAGADVRNEGERIVVTPRSAEPVTVTLEVRP